MKVLFTDLDGTLLNSHSLISDANLCALYELKKKNVVTVIATGRSLFSFFRAIRYNLPIDFIIFSSGAGILDYNKKTIIYKKSINKNTVKKIGRKLINNSINFFLHDEIPDNHFFSYSFNNHIINRDFKRRLDIYDGYSRPIEPNYDFNKKANQFLIVLEDIDKFRIINENLEEFKNYVNVIRATSPLDNNSVWIEIFQKQVSKSNAAQTLIKMLNINKTETFAIGNDYNDLDLLNWSEKSFIVDNAPEELKKGFIRTKSNDEDGFSEILKEI